MNNDILQILIFGSVLIYFLVYFIFDENRDMTKDEYQERATNLSIGWLIFLFAVVGVIIKKLIS